MVLDIFRAILCCCRSSDQNDIPHTHDETVHLIIPETVEAAVGTEEARLNQRKLRERLTEIVRSTEGKMVNVATQLPFNLHNRILPKAQSHSSSRSTLESVNPYHAHTYYTDFYPSREPSRFRKEKPKYFHGTHGLGRLGSISPSFRSEGGRTRSPSPNVEQPSAARLLNIRLVGYTENTTRGRARERTRSPSGLPGLKNPEGVQNHVEVAPATQEPAASEGTLPQSVTPGPQSPDVDAMILSWD